MKQVKFTYQATLFIYIMFCVIGNWVFGCIYIPLLIISINEIIKQIRNNNFITTYTFWQLGFSFIICLDGILTKEKVVNLTSNDVYTKTGIIFCISALIIIWYYRMLEKKNKKLLHKPFKAEANNFFFFIVCFFYLFFLVSEAPEAIESFFNSRFIIIGGDEFGGLNANKSILKQVSKFFSQFCGYLLPSFIFIWNIKRTSFNKALLNSFLLSAPIWIIYIIIGTRHNILYSFFGLVGCAALVKFSKFKFKSIYLVFLLVAYFASNTMLEARKHGFFNYIKGNTNERYSKLEKNITDQTTVYMSYVVDYYEEKPLVYGTSTATILFFWIPRNLWPDKPPQFSYWFIREYLGGQKGFNDKHSTPASYLGVPYSDFGYLGVILTSLLIAFLLNRLDKYFRKNQMLSDYKRLVFVSFFLASIFFLPRQLSHLVSKVLILYLIITVIFYFTNKTFVIKKTL